MEGKGKKRRERRKKKMIIGRKGNLDRKERKGSIKFLFVWLYNGKKIL